MHLIESQIGLRGLGTAVPEHFTPLAELPLASPAETLAGLGYTGAYLAENAAELALTAARRALADAALAPSEIDLLLWASAARVSPAEKRTARRQRAGCVLLQRQLAAGRAGP